MKTAFNILALLGFLGIVCPMSQAATVKIETKSCEYLIQIPNGWDTIPNDTLSVKFGSDMVDVALYKKDTNTYFDGEYIQYVFLPTVKSLNQFHFKQIAKDFKKSISQDNNQTSKDSVHLITHDFNVSDYQKCFFVEGVIKTHTKERHFTQCILPTKFGFLKIIYYSAINKENKELTIEEIYSLTEISDSYIYHEPSSNSNLSVWHIILAFGIGLLVYIIIQYGPGLFKKFK